MKTKFYLCPICGNLLVKIEDGGVTPHCCGQQMAELVAGEADVYKDKHVPVVEFRSDVCCGAGSDHAVSGEQKIIKDHAAGKDQASSPNHGIDQASAPNHCTDQTSARDHCTDQASARDHCTGQASARDHCTDQTQCAGSGQKECCGSGWEEGCTVLVKVGSEAHPMTPEHHIDFVLLETVHGAQLRYLSKNGKIAPKAEVEFCDCKDPVVAVYEHCNLHGLWKAEVPDGYIYSRAAANANGAATMGNCAASKGNKEASKGNCAAAKGN